MKDERTFREQPKQEAVWSVVERSGLYYCGKCCCASGERTWLLKQAWPSGIQVFHQLCRDHALKHVTEAELEATNAGMDVPKQSRRGRRQKECPKAEGGS